AKSRLPHGVSSTNCRHLSSPGFAAVDRQCGRQQLDTRANAEVVERVSLQVETRPTSAGSEGAASTTSVQHPHCGVEFTKSGLAVSSPVAKARAAALIRDCAWARATAVRAVASPVCAEVASVNVPTPCA